MGYASPGATTAVVYCVVPAILISVIALALVRAFGQRRRLRSLANPAVAVVEGVVEADTDGSPPVEVAIVQSGDQSRGSYHWKEIRRTARARPFHLRIADGSLVRVDPSDSPTLVSPLDEVGREPKQRTLRAALAPGARAYVVGQRLDGVDPHVQGGYRSAPAAAVVRPAPGRAMLVATERPDGVFRARARYHLTWALALLAVFAIDQLWFTGYFERSRHGEVVWGRAKDRWGWQTEASDRHGSHRETHYSIQVAVSDGRRIDQEIGFDDYVQIAEGDRVPFIVVPGRPGASQIGEIASAHAFLLFGAIVTAVIAALAYLARSTSTRPWYESEQLDHYGRGSLDGSPTPLRPPA